MQQALGMQLHSSLELLHRQTQSTHCKGWSPPNSANTLVGHGDPDQQNKNSAAPLTPLGGLPRTAHHSQTLLAKVLPWFRALRTAQGLIWESQKITQLP